MELKEFKEWIADRRFRSTTGADYRFISGTTLQVNGNMANSIQYEIFQDEDGSFLLDHKGIIPTKIGEPLKMGINKPHNPNEPISLVITGRTSNDFFGTWIEILPDEY